MERSSSSGGRARRAWDRTTGSTHRTPLPPPAPESLEALHLSLLQTTPCRELLLCPSAPLSAPEKPHSLGRAPGPHSFRVSTGSRGSRAFTGPSLVRVLLPEWAQVPDAMSPPAPGPVPSCCQFSSERLGVCCPRLRPRLHPPRVMCWALASRPGPAPCRCRAPLSPPPALNQHLLPGSGGRGRWGPGQGTTCVSLGLSGAEH